MGIPRSAVHVPRGYMHDASVSPRSGGPAISTAISYQLVVTAVGQVALRMSVDPAWVHAPGRVFPGTLRRLECPSGLTSPTSLFSSNVGTPRSSLDLYSASNHSDETLASEYPTQPFIRQSVRNHRRPSTLAEVEEPTGPETLMMGYAQVAGSFTLDGSLINQAPFEEVKRKGVVGSQGGGVAAIFDEIPFLKFYLNKYGSNNY